MKDKRHRNRPIFVIAIESFSNKMNNSPQTQTSAFEMSNFTDYSDYDDGIAPHP